ncbi:MAG: ZIP family metal transporter [Candidatus Bathyarchaeia archaeon]
MIVIVMILLSVSLISLISFIGILFLGFNDNLLRRILIILVSFASGSLLGGAFMHLIPHSLEELGSKSVFWWVIVGIMMFFFMEKFLYWRHCHDGKCPIHMFAYLNLLGDGIHNFIDGMIVAASFLASIPLGLAATTATILHEIPQEIGDFGVLIYGGLGRKKALIYNFISALTSIAGAIVTYLFYHAFELIHESTSLLIPFAAGGFIYIATTDLMPELHKRRNFRESILQMAAIILGLALMWLLSFIE